MSERPAFDTASRPLVAGRVPSLPVDTALALYGDADPLEAARRFFAQNGFARAAVAVASPSLARAIEEWIAGASPRSAKTPLRALAYLLRMATRPTPFGLFAGVAEVPCGPATSLEIAENAGERRSRTRPDMELLGALADELERGPLRDRVRYRASETAIVRGDRLYVTNVALANYTPAEGEARAEQREISLKNTAAVRFVREFCSQAVELGALVRATARRFEAEEGHARILIETLIAAGAIVSELRPSPLGDPVAYLRQRFEELGAPFARELRAALDEADLIDRQPLRERRAAGYASLCERFGALAGEPPASVLQVDLRAPLAGTLGTHVLQDAALLADSLARMGRVVRLRAFRERFVARYEGAERMVPLLELADNNLGLGFPESPEADPPDPERDAFVLGLACEAMRSNAEEIALEGELLDRFLPPLAPGDETLVPMEVGFSLAARSLEEIDRGEYAMVAGFFSDGALKSLGRFASLLGDGFVEAMRDCARRAAAPHDLNAEFAYAPVPRRSYNVAIRPALYEREVRAGIGAPPHGEPLAPEDLWAGLDGDRFFLWSRSLRRRVCVRETHALATQTNAPNLCRLLALLQVDGRRVPAVDWGSANDLTYLPRLRRGRVVIAPRRWIFARAQFGSGARAAARELERLRSVWALPRYVYLTDGDNRLLLDLDAPVSAELFAEHAAAGCVRIDEALPVPGTAWLRGRDGAHAIELVAQALPARGAAAAPQRREPVTVERRTVYGPASTWMYLKLYLGAQAMDNLIASAIAPLARLLRSRGEIDRWFFVRYADPQPHVRLRVHASSDAAARGVRDTLLEAAEGWLQSARIRRYALDTYDPEYERYGECVDAAERWFAHESDGCAALLAEGLDDVDERIEVAASSFDALLARDGAFDRAVLDAFGRAARKKLAPKDRDALRRIAARAPTDREGALLLAEALGEQPQRLADFVHLFCNRMGLQGESEERVACLLRALALARLARTALPA